jgi:hypothetical protein
MSSTTTTTKAATGESRREEAEYISPSVQWRKEPKKNKTEKTSTASR